MRTITKHSMIYELTMPVSSWIHKAYAAAEDFITQIHVNHLRKQVLHKQLEGLTDPTFLDRVEAGESNV